MHQETELFDQLDSSILLEVLSEEKIKGKKRRLKHQKTKQYIETLQYAKISIPAFGEVAKTIVRDAENDFDKAYVFIRLVRLLWDTNITFNAPQRAACRMLCAVMDFDYTIEPQDAMRIAEAKETGAKRFVTLDEKLVDKKALQERFRIKIEFPWGEKPVT
ncbi:PIN domain-containing protein [Candidatus Woesearchaeota archaeon]|nr:PIN domain-containing protein [Candidatus Woesearchaeota archaeon]